MPVTPAGAPALLDDQRKPGLSKAGVMGPRRNEATVPRVSTAHLCHLHHQGRVACCLHSGPRRGPSSQRQGSPSLSPLVSLPEGPVTRGH